MRTLNCGERNDCKVIWCSSIPVLVWEYYVLMYFRTLFIFTYLRLQKFMTKNAMECFPNLCRILLRWYIAWAPQHSASQCITFVKSAPQVATQLGFSTWEAEQFSFALQKCHQQPNDRIKMAWIGVICRERIHIPLVRHIWRWFVLLTRWDMLVSRRVTVTSVWSKIGRPSCVCRYPSCESLGRITEEEAFELSLQDAQCAATLLACPCLPTLHGY